jgi:hypothetical protein
MRDEKLKLEDLKASRALCGALKAFPSTYYVFFLNVTFLFSPLFLVFIFSPSTFAWVNTSGAEDSHRDPYQQA